MIQVLSKTREMLRYVADSNGGLRLFELTELMGLKRSTVHNIASSLIHEGILYKDENSKYQLGPFLEEIYLLQQNNGYLKAVREIMIKFSYLVNDSHLTFAKFGQNEIIGQFVITPDQPHKTRRMDAYVLNPYFTVSGILHFAFLPDSILNLLKMRHPFIPRGLELWKDEEKFTEAVEACRKHGYAILPLDPPEMFRLGIAVRHDGNFIGSLTWTKNKATKEEREIMLKEITVNI